MQDVPILAMTLPIKPSRLLLTTIGRRNAHQELLRICSALTWIISHSGGFTAYA